MSTAHKNNDKVALPQRRTNRPIRWNHHFEFVATRALIALFKWLGVDRASAFTGAVLRFVGPKLRKISQRGEANLRMVYPEWTDEKIRETIKDVWENLGRTTAEFAHLEAFKIDGPDNRIEFEGHEYFDPYIESGEPVILVAGHLGNWEIPAVVAQQVGLDYAIIYRPANNPLVDEYIINRRAKVMTRIQIPKGKPGALAFMDALKKKRSIALLIDQKFNEGISIPFLGFEAMTAPAPARAAIRFNLPIIVVTNERKEGAFFKMRIHKPIFPEVTGNMENDVRALTIKANEILETQIRAQPAQWLWLHRRWPKQP